MTFGPTRDFVLECREIWFEYPDGARILKNIDFRVARGRIVALLAPNGAGKTTLLKIIARLLKPRRGKVLLDGQAIDKMTTKTLYHKLGLVLQNPQDQIFANTVEEDVAFGPRNLNLPEKEVHRRITASLTAVGAEELRYKSTSHLSFGEQKRICLAGVIAMQPSVLLLDEPTASLDPQGEHAFLRLLHTINQTQGTTVIAATHSVDLIPGFADEVLILKDGSIAAAGTPLEVFSNPKLIEQSNLRLPYIGELMLRLKNENALPEGPLPLSVEDAHQRLVEILVSRTNSSNSERSTP